MLARSRFPANAVVCLSDEELSTTSRTGGCVSIWKSPPSRNQGCGLRRRLIISARDWNFRFEPERPAAENLSGGPAGADWRLSPGIWAGFCRVSHPGSDQSQRVRIGDRQSLLRGAAEKRQNAVHLRSAAARALRPRAVSARRNAAVLVSQPASGAANGYLKASARMLRRFLRLGRKRWGKRFRAEFLSLD